MQTKTKKNLKSKIILTTYILLLSLIPTLWFSDGQLITGTDVNFSPFPLERVINRLYTWDPSLLSGSPKSHNTGTLSYIFTSGLLTYLTNSPYFAEIGTFVIWFSLTGFSMSFMLEKIFYNFEEKEKLYIKMFGVLLYMVNFYNMFQWVRLHLTITTLVLLPILFGVMYKIFSRNILDKKDLLILSLGAILGGSFATQPPLIYAVIMMLLIMALFYLAFDFKNYKLIIQKFKKVILALLTFILSGAYWIIPQGFYIFTADFVKSDVGVETFKVHELLGWTSKTTSNLNVFRNFGEVVWLDGWGGHAYFPEFCLFIKILSI